MEGSDDFAFREESSKPNTPTELDAPGEPGQRGQPGELNGDPRAEAELVAMLAERKFQGVLWERFANELGVAGLAVLTPWIATGRIFRELRRKGIRCRGPVGGAGLDPDQLASETVARAINPFRDKILTSEQWNPHGDARLRTLFVTQCLFQFPNVYREWLRATHRHREEWSVDAEVLARVEEQSRGDPGAGSSRDDPEAAAISRQECEWMLDALPDRLRAVIQLVVRGHTFKDAARLLGEDYRPLQEALRRIRPALREQLRERRRNEEGP